MANPGQNLSVEVMENGDVRVTLHHPSGNWVIDCAAGTHPMATIETPCGHCHDVLLGPNGDINVIGIGWTEEALLRS